MSNEDIKAQVLAKLAQQDTERAAAEAARKNKPTRCSLSDATRQEYGIAALAREARQRHTTYGKLCMRLDEKEQNEIIRAYADEQARKKR